MNNIHWERLTKWTGILLMLLFCLVIMQELYLSFVRPTQPDNMHSFVVPMILNHGRLVYLSNMDVNVRIISFRIIGAIFAIFVILKVRSIGRGKAGSN